MALDSRDKSFSMMGDDLPYPDGSINAGDSMQLLGLYRFDFGVFEPTHGMVLYIRPLYTLGVER